jgi:hypothetical protein
LRRRSWINKNSLAPAKKVPPKIVALLQWTQTSNGKLPVKEEKPLMRKAPPTSLLRKKPERPDKKAVKLLMKEGRLTSLLPKKPEKPDKKGDKSHMKEGRLTNLLPKKPEKPAAKEVKPLMEKPQQANPAKAVRGVKAVRQNPEQAVRAVKALKEVVQKNPDRGNKKK